MLMECVRVCVCMEGARVCACACDASVCVCASGSILRVMREEERDPEERGPKRCPERLGARKRGVPRGVHGGAHNVWERGGEGSQASGSILRVMRERRLHACAGFVHLYARGRLLLFCARLVLHIQGGRGGVRGRTC